MMRAVDTNPIITERYLKDALHALNIDGMMTHFGMFFLHDLNLDAGPDKPILDEIEEDSTSVLAVMKHLVARKQTRQPTERQPTSEEIGNYYPLGMTPTWAAIKECLLTQPAILLKKWMFPSDIRSRAQVGRMFVTFTQQWWKYLELDESLAESLDHLSTLEEAMAAWTLENIHSRIPDVVIFEPCNARFPGSRPGLWDQPFGERKHTYFSPSSFHPPEKSEWRSFLAQKGYLTEYHNLLRDIEEADREPHSSLKAIDDDLELIFSNLQCLPVTTKATHSTLGKTWTVSKGKVKIVVNDTYFNVEGIENGHGRNQKPSKRLVKTRKRTFEKKIGCVTYRKPTATLA